MESIKYGLITYQKEKAESLSKSHANGINYEKISDGLTEKYKDELRFTESQIEGINLELTYSKKLDEENTDLIKELSAKKYKLFTKSNDKNELDKLYQYEQLN